MEVTFTHSEMIENLKHAEARLAEVKDTPSRYRYGSEDFWYWESKRSARAGEVSEWKRALREAGVRF